MMKIRLPSVILIVLFSVLALFSEELSIPIRLKITKLDGTILECKAIGIFNKYRAGSVVIEGVRDSFHISDGENVHRLGLKYLQKAKFEVISDEDRNRLYCEWTVKFPGSKDEQIFKGYFPNDLDTVYELSLVCVDRGDEYRINVLEISNIQLIKRNTSKEKVSRAWAK